jgi:hypothetical protein
MKVRLSSLALSRSGHPYPEDRILQLARRTLSLCWTMPEWSFFKKLVATAWVGYVACAPAPLLLPAIDLAFVPTKRLPAIQKMMSKEEKAPIGAKAHA